MSKKATTQKLSRDELVELMREMLSGKHSDGRIGILSQIFEQHFPHPNWLDLMYDPPSSAKYRQPEEIVDLALAYVPVTVDHPLLDRLVGFAKHASETLFPGKNYRGVFHPTGINFCDEIRKSSYWCDPENSAEFIATGGDGWHYCFLVVDNAVHEDSPIILCRPDCFGEPNVIVGENLLDFLCFGMHCAYFNILGVLEYPDDRTDDWYGDEVWEEQRQILELLRREFDLKPWTNRQQRFKELQERFLPLFIAPPEL